LIAYGWVAQVPEQFGPPTPFGNRRPEEDVG